MGVRIIAFVSVGAGKKLLSQQYSALLAMRGPNGGWMYWLSFRSTPERNPSKIKYHHAPAAVRSLIHFAFRVRRPPVLNAVSLAHKPRYRTIGPPQDGAWKALPAH